MKEELMILSGAHHPVFVEWGGILGAAEQAQGF